MNNAFNSSENSKFFIENILNKITKWNNINVLLVNVWKLNLSSWIECKIDYFFYQK